MSVDIPSARPLAERRTDCLDRADLAARRGRVNEARRWLALARDYDRLCAEAAPPDQVHSFHTRPDPAQPAPEAPAPDASAPPGIHSFHTFHTPEPHAPAVAELLRAVRAREARGVRADDLRRRLQRLQALPIGPPGS